jgi:hypothetical protein
VTYRVLLLAACAAAFWVVLGLPARHLGGGDEALLFSGVAVALSLAPGVLVLLWCGWAFEAAPRMQAIVALGSGGLRMGFVLLAALALFFNSEEFHRPAFLFWVAGAYLFLLAVEVALLVRAMRAAQPSETPGA